MGIDDEKASFLKAIENETLSKNLSQEVAPPKKATPLSGIAIFASLFISFLFIIVLLIFVMAISPGNNPILQSFGVEATRVKEFLLGLVDNTFLVLTIFLMLLFSLGIFRGFSLPKDGTHRKKRAFIFGAVSGSLIFLVILAWIGSAAFIQRFVVSPGQVMVGIEMIDAPEEIIAPIDLHFSAKRIASKLEKQGEKIKGFRWDKENDGIFEIERGGNPDVMIHFNNKGTQTVAVQIELEGGSSFVSKREFQISDSVFRITPSNIGSSPFKPEFDASSISQKKSVKSFSWDFDGDGNFDEQTRSSKTVHVFERIGTYQVILRIEYEDGDVEIFRRDVVVSPPKEKAIVSIIKVYPDIVGTAPFEVTLSGENSSSLSGKITSYKWNFEDGSTAASGMSVKRIFTLPGTHVVKLIVENADGLSAESTISIEVKASESSPSAIFSTKPEAKGGEIRGSLPLEIEFDASKSIDPDDDIVKYEWFFGQNEIPDATGSKIKHTFRTEGKIPVILKVKDSAGNESTATVNVVVEHPAIFVDFDITPETGTVPLTVELDGSHSTCRKEGCKILSFEWEYGDSSSKELTGAHATHQYQEVGVFTIRLTVTTNLKERASVEKIVAVRTPPLEACFEASRKRGVAPLSVSFDPGCSQGEVKKYSWDFGDGVISEQRKPIRTFEKTGKYTVTLSIFDEKKRVGTYSDIIVVE
jgi:PKD repeat protein